MKVALVFLGLTALAAAAYYPKKFEKRVADQVFLQRQKSLLDLVYRVHQPVLIPEIIDIARNYQIQDNLDKYTNVDAVKSFLNFYRYGMLPQGEIFSIVNDQHKEEVIHLFDAFYYAKDWDTFYKTAVWARVNMNPGQFVYALSVAVFHREDTRGLVLPPLYEIYPQLFVETDVIQKAYETRMQLPYGQMRDEVVIPVNRTGLYPYYLYDDDTYTTRVFNKYQYGADSREHYNSEGRMGYFTEDIALNSYYTYLHFLNPFWMNATYNYNSERRGEFFYYYNQQLLARYELERLSNDLLHVEPLTFETPIEYGYHPNLRYPNGKEFPFRADYIKPEQYDTYEYSLIKDFHRRIIDAMELGFVYTEKGEKVFLTEERGIDFLGQLFENTADSINYKYYGSLYRLSLHVIGHIVDPHYNHKVAPGTLEHYETVLRDPVYYRLLKSFNYIFYRYKSYLPRYQREQFYFPGLKVDSVDVDKLVTYFDNFDIDISQAVQVSKPEEDIVIKARQYRLNHKPFTYKLNVVSDKATDVMVRVFIGPKYDAEGRVLDINEKRTQMVEFDRFPYQVTVGQNTITRNSRDFYGTVQDFTTTRDLYKNVVDAIQGKTEYYVDEEYNFSFYPDRLVLPKGKRGGMPYVFFFAVTPFTQKEQMTEKKMVQKYNYYFQDKYPMGYPFDRVIDQTQFYVPNFYEKDVIIFHKRVEDINNLSI